MVNDYLSQYSIQAGSRTTQQQVVAFAQAILEHTRFSSNFKAEQDAKMTLGLLLQVVQLLEASKQSDSRQCQSAIQVGTMSRHCVRAMPCRHGAAVRRLRKAMCCP